MKLSKRIISLFLVIAITIPVFVVTPAYAGSSFDSNDIIIDTESVLAWSLWMDANIVSNVDNIKPQIWNVIDSGLNAYGFGRCFSVDNVRRIGLRLNSYFSSESTWNKYLSNYFMSTNFIPSFTLVYDSVRCVYRPQEVTTGLWLVNSSGQFPYYKPDSPDQEVSYSYQWRNTSQSTWNAGYAIVSYLELKDILSIGYDGIIERRGDFLHIFDSSGNGTQVLCTEEGFPLSVIADLSSSAVDTPNNYYSEGDKGDPVYNQFVDITNNTTWFPNGTLQYIDKIVFDDSTNTYIVDSHDSYTYNSTTNNYVTNNYRYEYNYYIDYTSVTYIGTTEQYDEEFKFYYQLPDGRSSADLTAEDLEQLSIAFTDVVNYARSADDANMRVLYHFDGNTQDSSYWSYCTDFTWNSGASLTYMDEGVFGGSLYLDETAHDFTIKLPSSSDGSGDYTLQFRYYQSYTAAPVMDSYIQLGDTIVFRTNGSNYYSYDGSKNTVISQTSIGTWNEIAFMCLNGILYYYINGVLCGNITDGNFNRGTITFHFGSEQQTYKKLDEFRFSRGALYPHGDNYEPTAVPHDTNLTLILPDGERPIADEIVIIRPSDNNMFDSSGSSDWSTIDVASSLFGRSNLYGSPTPWIPSEGYPVIGYDTSKVTLSQSNGFVHVDFGGSNYRSSFTYSSNTYYKPNNALFLPIVASYSHSGGLIKYGFDAATNYTLSVVLSDGSYSSITFSLSKMQVNNTTTVSINKLSDINFAYGIVGRPVNSNTEYQGSCPFGIFIYSETGSADIAYMELVKGTVPRFEIDFEMAMYSSGELENSPVLAVRSNQTIIGYQIGGVRPSYPAKGQVWAMVENGRITSLQQYSGSAWVEVDGRIWTGQRWIPYSSFDVFLLKDCYDIQGTVTGDDYEYIYSESGFWAWFQKQWLAFMAKLDQILDAVQKISGTGGSDVDIEVNVPGSDDTETWTFIDLVSGVKDGVMGFTTGLVTIVFNGFTGFVETITVAGSFFDSFDPNNSNGIFAVGSDNIWD